MIEGMGLMGSIVCMYGSITIKPLVNKYMLLKNGEKNILIG
jgi:hypothetical protein